MVFRITWYYFEEEFNFFKVFKNYPVTSDLVVVVDGFLQIKVVIIHHWIFRWVRLYSLLVFAGLRISLRVFLWIHSFFLQKIKSPSTLFFVWYMSLCFSVLILFFCALILLFVLYFLKNGESQEEEEWSTFLFHQKSTTTTFITASIVCNVMCLWFHIFIYNKMMQLDYYYKCICSFLQKKDFPTFRIYNSFSKIKLENKFNLENWY